MHTTTGKKLLTSAEYIHLIEQGVVTENDRVELIEGEVVEKMTVGNRHIGRVSRLAHLFIGRFGDRATWAGAKPSSTAKPSARSALSKRSRGKPNAASSYWKPSL